MRITLQPYAEHDHFTWDIDAEFAEELLRVLDAEGMYKRANGIWHPVAKLLDELVAGAEHCVETKRELDQWFKDLESKRNETNT